ncbi:MAG: N-acyl-D-amino-acid deacylase family protein [Terriglobales bacterium]
MNRKFLAVLALILASVPALAQQYDVLIRNGRVVDGTGNPWFYADVGITGDRITLVGRAPEGATARRTLDAKGLVVAPGFIDMLGQSEMALLIDKSGFSKLTQGVTTEITGEGESIAPQNDETIAALQDFLTHYHLTVDWRTLDQYFRRLEKQGSGLNLGTYVGAAQVREVVVGREDRAPTADELQRMQQLVDEAMRQGALGVSTALIYAPGNYARTEELIALAKVAARHGGIYASHIRSEGDAETAALQEAFRIGREAGLPVEIFHLKVSGKPNWGRMRQVVEMVEQARASGLDVAADQYPYLAGATALSSTIPPKYHAGGTPAMVARLKDPAVRAAIRGDLESGRADFENWWQLAGPSNIMVNQVLNPALKRFEGKRVAEIAGLERKDALDALLDIVIADNDNTGAIYFVMSEDDLELAMRQPWVSVGTDYNEVAPAGPLSEGKAHPRAYGSFPRILGQYVREQHLMPLEMAVRKFTSLPAHRVKLEQRGELKPGNFADVTIFDPARVNDLASYENPARTSVGIEYVFVNGVLSVEHEKLTGQVGGRPLRGPGYEKK